MERIPCVYISYRQLLKSIKSLKMHYLYDYVPHSNVRHINNIFINTHNTIKKVRYIQNTMPVCYVVVSIPDPQVLCVFFDQIKARRFVENYSTDPNQHIIIFTSWCDDERSKKHNISTSGLDRFS